MRTSIRKAAAFRAGYISARLNDADDMPLDMSIRDVLLIGGIGILILLGGYFLG